MITGSGCCSWIFAVVAVVVFLAGDASHVAADTSAVKMTRLEGIVDLSGNEPAPYVLEGIASHLGKFQATGEVEFVSGAETAEMIGTGPVVLQAANGDRLVGVATWTVDPAVDGASIADIHFAWRDAVVFSDGTIVTNTGRFTTRRPPGLIVVVSTEEQNRNDLIILLIRIIIGR